jgi:hypothetical protein
MVSTPSALSTLIPPLVDGMIAPAAVKKAVGAVDIVIKEMKIMDKMLKS